jgi:hypothetical protein
MIKKALTLAILLPSAAFAAVSVLTPKPQAPEQNATVVSAHGMWGFEQLSMGPDPGGHTGATVTPETSKTGQPSHDGAGTPNQSGATNSGTSGANAGKQPSDSSGKKPSDTPATSSTTGQQQPSKDR